MSKFDYRKFRSYLSKYHNVHVKLAIRKSKQEANASNRLVTSRRLELLQSCLVDGNDTAQLVLLKEIFFWVDLGYLGDRLQSIATLPEYWPKRVGNDYPQLVVAWRPQGKKSTYQISIPHYNGDRNPKIPAYRKGSHRGELTCTDGSKLVVNADSIAEADRVIKVLRRYIEPRFHTGRDAHIAKVKGPGFKEARVVPIVADFYRHGQTEDARPNWRKYF